MRNINKRYWVIIALGFVLPTASGCNPLDPPLEKYEANLQQYENPQRILAAGDMHYQATIKTYEAAPLYPPAGTVPYRDDGMTLPPAPEKAE